jgi:DNA-binding MurR/RpiR family transcriptional regulator
MAVRAYEIPDSHIAMSARDVAVCVSQSGETADALHAARFARGTGASVIALDNNRYGDLSEMRMSRWSTRSARRSASFQPKLRLPRWQPGIS